MKKIISTIISLSLLSGASLVFAHDGEELAQVKKYNASKSNTAATEAREAIKEAAIEKREAIKTAVGEQREALKDAAVKGKEAVRNLITEKREAVKTAQTEFKANLQKEREAFKQKVETAKEEAKQKREVQKAELKTKLEKIKDEKKKAAVGRLDNRFTEINAKQTNHLLKTLTRLEELLGKVSARADKAATNGKDVSSVRMRIEQAKTVIASARTALESQLKKTYLIQVTDETQLKSAVATAREALNKDLKAAREAVQTAHKAVVDATRNLKGVPKVDEEASAVEAPANTETAPVPAPTQ